MTHDQVHFLAKPLPPLTWRCKIALPHVRIRNLALSCQRIAGVELIYRKDNSTFIFQMQRKGWQVHRKWSPGVHVYDITDEKKTLRHRILLGRPGEIITLKEKQNKATFNHWAHWHCKRVQWQTTNGHKSYSTCNCISGEYILYNFRTHNCTVFQI